LGHSLIIIPTYNEIENIDDITAAVLKQNEEFDVLEVLEALDLHFISCHHVAS